MTGCFAHECKPPVIDKEDLWRGAKSAQQEVAARVARHMAGGQVSVGGSEVDVAQEVWAATMKEVEKGWATGPFSAEQVSEVSEVVGPLRTQVEGFA